MNVATASAAFSSPAAQRPPIEAIADPDLFPSRDSLIRHLVGVCGWSRPKVAGYFNLSPRQLRRITTPERLRVNLTLPAVDSTLTRAEIEMMARDYASDPYILPEDREAAWTYIDQGCPLVSA